MIARIFLATTGISHWREAFDKDIDVASELVFGLKFPVTVILIILLVLGVLLNAVCWQRRDITKILIHYELFYNSVLTLVPYDYGNATSFTMFYWTLCVFIYTSCSSNSMVDILSCTTFTAI